MPTQILTINGKTGEYTGFSSINGVITHYFSMYDGSVICREDVSDMQVIPFPSASLSATHVLWEKQGRNEYPAFRGSYDECMTEWEKRGNTEEYSISPCLHP